MQKCANCGKEMEGTKSPNWNMYCKDCIKIGLKNELGIDLDDKIVKEE